MGALVSLLLRQLRRRIPDGPPYRPAVVHWTDTHPVNGWHDPDTLDDGPCVITSVAYVLPWATKADHLSICQDVAPTGEGQRRVPPAACLRAPGGLPRVAVHNSHESAR